MPGYGNGQGFAMGLQLVQNFTEVKAQMEDRAQRIAWEKQSPGFQAHLEEASAPYHEAEAAYAEAAASGDPKAMADAERRVMSTTTAFAARAKMLSAQLAASGNKYAAQAGATLSDKLDGLVQAGFSYAQQQQALLAQHEEAVAGREHEATLQGRQLGSQEQIAAAGRASQERVAGADIASRERVAGAELGSRERIAGAELGQRREQAGAEQALRGRELDIQQTQVEKLNLGDTAQLVAHVAAGRLDGSLSEEQADQLLGKAGLSKAQRDPELWTKALEDERGRLQKALKTAGDPKLRARIEKRLQKIAQDSDALVGAQLDAGERPGMLARLFGGGGGQAPAQVGAEGEAPAQRAAGGIQFPSDPHAPNPTLADILREMRRHPSSTDARGRPARR